MYNFFSIAVQLIFILLAFKVSAKETICSITINSSNEINTFKKKLDSKKFDFKELTEMGESNWLDSACKSNIRCDVLLISGHFAGEFFGLSDKTLKSSDLVERSCSKSCDNILRSPQEVFLFGCNTLSDAGALDRPSDEIRRSLANNRMDAVAIERVMLSREGDISSSYKKQLRIAFSGVPHVYGFDSIAPSGSSVEGRLEKYLSTVGDYSKHLGDIKSASVAKTINYIIQIFSYQKN